MSVNVAQAKRAQKLLDIVAELLSEADPGGEMTETWSSVDRLVDDLDVDITRVES